MIDGMIPLKTAAKEARIKYATLLHHVNAGKFPEAKMLRGTRWYLPMETVKKLCNNEINFSSIYRGKKKESEFEKSIREMLKNRGCKAVKIQGMGNKGLPDRIVLCPNGICFFLELKTINGKLSEHQKMTQKEIKDLGHKVYTCTKIDSLRKYLSKVLK